MIDRYTRPEMAALWSEEAQFKSWLDVELAACAAWSELGVIPKEDVDRLYERSSPHVGASSDKPLWIIDRHYLL